MNGNNILKNSIKLAFISHLPSLILAKSPKKVNDISKFFKKNTENKGKKLYIQALSFSSNTTRETSNTVRETLNKEGIF